MTRPIVLSLMVAVAAACAKGSDDPVGSEARAARTPAPPPRFDLGTTIDSARLAHVDIDVAPDGKGLPAGHGTVAQGAAVYAAKCAACHGAKGEGMAPNPKLVGREPREGFPFGNDPKLAKTIGNYWPYATTLYDYVRRTMPYQAPGTLTPDEVYSVVAWLLAENEIVPRDARLDASSLAAIKMPARDRFVVDDRRGGSEVR